MAGGGEDDVDGVAFGAYEEAAAHVSIVFHVSDDRFDAAAPFEFAFDGWAQASCWGGFLAGDEDLFLFGRVVASVSAIHVDPLRVHAGDPPAFSHWLYKQRNAVERFFNKLKHFRAVATRYDKRDDNYLASVILA